MTARIVGPAMRLVEHRCWLQKTVWPAGRIAEVRQLRVSSLEPEQVLWEAVEVVQGMLAVHQTADLGEALKDWVDWGKGT